jgi:hypothetical protein
LSDSKNEITRLLHQWQAGDRQAESDLFELLLPDLRNLAGRHFRKERAGHTLQPTALVNEAFLRLARAKNVEWQDRGHFFAIAGRVMRRYLIDYARARPDAQFLNLSLHTLQREWYRARRWLFERLSSKPATKSDDTAIS